MIAGYYVNNVYLVNSDTVLIRLHHSERPDIRIVLSTIKGIWITKYELPKKSSGIATKLRKEIHRAKIKNIKNPTQSVKKPGVIKSNPEINKKIPPLISSAGMIP